MRCDSLASMIMAGGYVTQTLYLHDMAEVDRGRVGCGASCYGLVSRMSVWFDLNLRA